MTLPQAPFIDISHPNTSFFGQYLLQSGVVTDRQLLEGLSLQERRNQLLGELALARGYLSTHQIQETAREQKKLDLPFGVIALRKKYLSPKQLDDLLFSQVVTTTHIGEALVDLGHLPADRLGRLLNDYMQLEQDRHREIVADLRKIPEQQVIIAGIEALHRAFLRFTGSPMTIMDLAARSTSARSWIFQIWLETVDGARIAMTTSLTERSALQIAARLAGSETDIRCHLRCQGRNRLFFTIVKRYIVRLLQKQGVQVARSGMCTGNVDACPHLLEAHVPDWTERFRIQMNSPVGLIETRFFLSGWKQSAMAPQPEIHRPAT